MHVTVRSYLTAGVAFVGAGAIAVSPISPINPSLQDVQVPSIAVSSAPVELAALVNPIELWATVLATAAGNIGVLAETFLANPAPILGKIAGNALITASTTAELLGLIATGFFTGLGTIPGNLQVAVEQLLAGDIENGLSNFAIAFIAPVVQAAFGVLGRLGDITALLQNPFENISNVIGAAVPGVLGVGFPLLSFVLTPVFQVGITGQAIFDGLTGGDLEAALNAVISFPSDMANTILNGLQGSGGLLGDFGVIEGLLNFRQALADAIQPPALAPVAPALVAANAVPDLAAPTLKVSLSTEQTKVAETPELTSVEGTGAELPADPAPEVQEPTPPVVDEDEPTTPTGAEETNSAGGGAESETKTEQRASAESRSERSETRKAERASKKEAKAAAGADGGADSTGGDSTGGDE